MSMETQSQIIQRLLADNQHLPGALLPVLHAIQDALGYIPAEEVGTIAQALNLSRAEVHGVISFYHHFRSAPPAHHVLQICRAEACLSMGGESLWKHACQRLGLNDANPHAQQAMTSRDGAVDLQPVYCLGLCSTSPALALNEKLHARVDHKKFDQLLSTVLANTGSKA